MQSPITISPCLCAIVITNVKKEEHMISVSGKLTIALHWFSTHLWHGKSRYIQAFSLSVIEKTKSTLRLLHCKELVKKVSFSLLHSAIMFLRGASLHHGYALSIGCNITMFACIVYG